MQYLNSQHYAFHTLFLFSQITAEQKIVRLINRRLIIQHLSGDERSNEELSDEVSPIQKIVELLGSGAGLMASLSVEDFKNPQLGQLICQAPIPSLQASIL